jgi:hypothetical protein
MARRTLREFGGTPDRFDGSDIAIEDFLLVVVLCLDYLVPDLELPTVLLRHWLIRFRRVRAPTDWQCRPLEIAYEIDSACVAAVFYGLIRLTPGSCLNPRVTGNIHRAERSSEPSGVREQISRDPAKSRSVN